MVWTLLAVVSELFHPRPNGDCHFSLMQVAREDVVPLAQAQIKEPQSFDPNMHRFCFTPRSIAYDETPLVSVIV